MAFSSALQALVQKHAEGLHALAVHRKCSRALDALLDDLKDGVNGLLTISDRKPRQLGTLEQAAVILPRTIPLAELLMRRSAPLAAAVADSKSMNHEARSIQTPTFVPSEVAGSLPGQGARLAQTENHTQVEPRTVQEGVLPGPHRERADQAESPRDSPPRAPSGAAPSPPGLVAVKSPSTPPLETVGSLPRGLPLERTAPPAELDDPGVGRPEPNGLELVDLHRPGSSGLSGTSGALQPASPPILSAKGPHVLHDAINPYAVFEVSPAPPVSGQDLGGSLRAKEERARCGQELRKAMDHQNTERLKAAVEEAERAGVSPPKVEAAKLRILELEGSRRLQEIFPVPPGLREDAGARNGFPNPMAAAFVPQSVLQSRDVRQEPVVDVDEEAVSSGVAPATPTAPTIPERPLGGGKVCARCSLPLDSCGSGFEQGWDACPDCQADMQEEEEALRQSHARALEQQRQVVRRVLDDPRGKVSKKLRMATLQELTSADREVLAGKVVEEWGPDFVCYTAASGAPYRVELRDGPYRQVNLEKGTVRCAYREPPPGGDEPTWASLTAPGATWQYEAAYRDSEIHDARRFGSEKALSDASMRVSYPAAISTALEALHQAQLRAEIPESERV